MSLEIKSKQENPLLKREKVWVSLEHPGRPTPQRANLLKEISKKLGAKEELVIVDKIFSTKGGAASDIKVFVYKKKEDVPKDKLEKMKRRMEKKKKEAAPAPAPEAKSEKPAGGPAEEEAKESEAKPAEGEPKPEGEKPPEEKEEKTEEPKPDQPKEEKAAEENTKEEKKD